MRLGTGIHPRHWHWGAWLLALLIAALVLLLTHRPTGGGAMAMELSSTPDPAAAAPAPAVKTPEQTPPSADKMDPSDGAITVPPAEGEPPTTAPAPPAGSSADGYVAEIVDSSFTVGPAEFFALDLPMNKGGARAVHLFGTVSTRGHKDIIVRLFRSSDYDLWLKQKSGRKPQALWTSARASSFTIDQDLPAGATGRAPSRQRLLDPDAEEGELPAPAALRAEPDRDLRHRGERENDRIGRDQDRRARGQPADAALEFGAGDASPSAASAERLLTRRIAGAA